MEYIEVAIEIAPFSEDASEIIIAEIDQLGFESYLTESPFLKCYIPRDSFSEPNLKTILSEFINSDFSCKYTLDLIPEKNWNAVWESDFEPVVIDNRCTVKATFHKGLPKTKYTITIDPKMAFGTGHHQTTSLMIDALLHMEGRGVDRKIKGMQVLDMGCGTGVLAILAAKMGALSPVHAIDIDHIAVQSAIENTKRNRVSDKVKALCGDASLIQSNKYDLILANINRNILLEDMSTYTMGLKERGILLISGFYEQDFAMLQAEGNRNGLQLFTQNIKEKWGMLGFVKKNRS